MSSERVGSTIVLASVLSHRLRMRTISLCPAEGMAMMISSRPYWPTSCGNLLRTSENRNTLNRCPFLIRIIIDKSDDPRCQSRVVLDLIQNRNTRSSCPNNKRVFDLARIQVVRRVKAVSENRTCLRPRSIKLSTGSRTRTVLGKPLRSQGKDHDQNERDRTQECCLDIIRQFPHSRKTPRVRVSSKVKIASHSRTQRKREGHINKGH